MTFQSIISTSNDYIVYWRVISAPSLCNFFPVAKQKYLLDTYPPLSSTPSELRFRRIDFRSPSVYFLFKIS